MGPPGQDLSQHQHWFSASDPWSHIAITNPTSSPTVPDFERHGIKTPFRDCSSECGTAPITDSAYGTMSRAEPSITNVSLYGDCDRSAETASVASLPRTLFHGSVFPMHDFWSRPVTSTANSLVCVSCNIKVKNKSELKKHWQRHKKPFRCPITDCSRSLGFSTSNDLHRHVRSRHPDADPKAVFYRCPVRNCRSEDKRWPRADNFKQHLKRVHQREIVMDDDLEKYIYKPRESVGSELAGLGSAVDEVTMAVSGRNSASETSPWNLGWQAASADEFRGASSNGIRIGECAYEDAATIDQQLDVSDVMYIDQDLHAGTQMQSAKFDMETDLSQLGECHIGLHNCPDSINPTSAERDLEFQSTFFDDASVPGNDSVLEERDRPNTATRTETVMLDDTNCNMPAPSVQLIQGSNEPPKALSVIETMVENNNDLDKVESPSSPNSRSTEDTENLQYSSKISVHQNAQSRVCSESSESLLEIDSENSISTLLTLLNDKKTLVNVLSKIDGATLANVLAPLGYNKSKNPTLKSDLHSRTGSSSEAGKSQVSCPHEGCGKHFARHCELKKHLKRHNKPYGCTYTSCDKRFGSKNDWKRHENSRHFQVEQWQCHESSPDKASKICGKIYNRRELFKTHLLREHAIKDPSSAILTPENRFGTRKSETFWCGFCKKSIEVQTISEFWVIRCDHIDKHFTDLLDISQWEPLGTGTEGFEVSLVPTTSSQASRDECAESLASADRSDNAERILKRHAADGEVRHSKSSKRLRATEVWYCCGCAETVLQTGFYCDQKHE
ncbi:hypothetical protein BD289DRAFT_248150 [Coniella lustricola]|uniref:C2H2-type domain-containing protein n=1 Tax=Coniella lustricola TaxID=2025994 RepID=A0A2T3A8W9_9PEZI|nr:hypothetical protein BD289DRAFT_248150 [Coniella lustricola]